MRSHDQRRYFILTAGRTGSTLLAAVLADAGAKFGMDPVQSWDPSTGSMEGSELHQTAALLLRANKISPARPSSGLRRCLWAALRYFGKAHVRRLLSRVVYLKGDVGLIVNPAFKMGFLPSIVISYRPFEEYAVSNAPRSGHSTLENLAAEYNRIYRNGLLWLFTFGGCVVSYKQLTDPNDTSWAKLLETVTGLSADQLVESRNRRLTRAPRPLELTSLDSSATRTFELVDAVRGRVIPPSPAVMRAQAGRLAKASGPQRLRIEVSGLWGTLRDRRIPWYAYAAALGCIFLYGFAPIDPIPDRIPIIGHFDDAMIVGLAFAVFVRLIPAAIKREYRTAAAARLAAR